MNRHLRFVENERPLMLFLENVVNGYLNVLRAHYAQCGINLVVQHNNNIPADVDVGIGAIGAIVIATLGPNCLPRNADFENIFNNHIYRALGNGWTDIYAARAGIEEDATCEVNTSIEVDRAQSIVRTYFYVGLSNM